MDGPSSMLSAIPIDIINVRVTFKKARVPLLEAIAFRDKAEALREIRLLWGVREAVILQTCNRVELYLVASDGLSIANKAMEYLASRAGAMKDEALKAVEVSLNHDALRHIMMIASGLDSMVVGENEILGQVWDAYLEAEAAGATGPVLRTVFSKALKVGKRVRNETNISRGAVSVGSIAVRLADSILGGINGKNILVIGAGEMGTSVAKALSRYRPNAIFIANRTYERAVKLAEEVSGKALRFDKLDEALIEADVVICATAAPHYILTHEKVTKVMANRSANKSMVIIDISNPRNVENSVREIKGVSLYCIDDLQPIIERNLEERKRSVEKAISIVEEELPILCRELKAQMIRDCISRLMMKVEETRKEEVSKALNMLGEISDRERQIIEDLSGILVKKLFMPLVENLREAAIKGDKEVVETAAKLLGLELFSIFEWSE
ncbi:MAG: glutamyl-tRNA reductase [Candidatus Bathyarchaeia archaeon]